MEVTLLLSAKRAEWLVGRLIAVASQVDRSQYETELGYTSISDELNSVAIQISAIVSEAARSNLSIPELSKSIDLYYGKEK